MEFDDREPVSASQLVFFFFFFVLGMVAEFIFKTWGD